MSLNFHVNLIQLLNHFYDITDINQKANKAQLSKTSNANKIVEKLDLTEENRQHFSDSASNFRYTKSHQQFSILRIYKT